MNRLQGKIALVTGAARGIGEAIARAFVAQGAHVFLTDVKDRQGRSVAEELGDQATYCRLDVREESEWRAVLERVVAKHERIDILVNNAGITGFEEAAGPQDPENAVLSDWHRVHRTNLDGVFLGCKHAIRTVRATGGSCAIVNISSRSGMVGIPGAAAYASSKAAVRNHTKTVALYCAGEGLAIRCNSIHPAAILTPMWEPMLGSGPDREKTMQALVQDCPMKRFGTPDEVASLAVLLASDEAAYMNGAELTIDGGILAGAALTPAAADGEDC